MLARRFKCGNQRLDEFYQSIKYPIRLYRGDCSSFRRTNGGSMTGSDSIRGNSVRQHKFELVGVRDYNWRSWQDGHFRFYSSEGGEGNARDEEHISVRDGVNFDTSGAQRTEAREDTRQSDPHARLGEQDQKEWLNNEKLAMENKRKESPFLSRKEKFKNEFLRRIVPWEKITVSWETFPYYVE